MQKKIQSSSELLKRIQSHEGQTISIAQIVEIFREGGFSLLLIVFAAPLALPLPALGVAQVLAVPILLLSSQLMVGRSSPWLPEKLANKRINTKNLNKVIDNVVPYLEKVEYFIRPRIRIFSTNIGHKMVGFACVCCAISVALPFPFSNTIPSIGIVLMSIGLLERDGLAIIFGMIIGFIGICLAAAIMHFGLEAVSGIFNEIRSLF